MRRDPGPQPLRGASNLGKQEPVIITGDVGWISDDDVDLSGACATPDPVPERIHFAPGERSITLEGSLEEP